MEYVGRAGHSGSACFLCDLSREPTDMVVDSGVRTISCLNVFPYNSGHLLIAPRRHAGDLTALEADEAAALVSATQRAIRGLTSAMGAEGFNIGINQGPAAGASVDHLHVHVVPRWSGDTNFMPVVAEAKVLPQHLQGTAKSLRQAFADLDSGSI